MKRIFRKIWRQLRGQHNHGRQALRSCWAQPSTEELESRRLLSGDIALYHNYAMPEDVNDDGALTLWDALQVHREMLAAQTLPLDLSPALNRGAPLGPAPEGEGGTDDAYFDVNGDNYLSPRDIQLVARGLNPEAHLGDKVHYDLRIFDADAGIERAVGLYDSNSTVVNVDLGDSFEFRVYVQDSRAGVLQAQMGVARAYVDVNFDATKVSNAGAVTHGPDYNDPTLNNADFAVGEINTAGSQQTGFTGGTAVPLQDELVLLYSIDFTADAVGTFSFTSESPDLTPPRDEQFGVLLFNDAAFTVLPTDIYFDQIDVNVVVSPVQAVSDAETINEDPLTPPVFDVLANDTYNGNPVVQPGDLIITDVTPLTTTNGSTIAINPGGLDLTYTPALNFNGTEIFIYEATDVATGTFSDTGQLTVTVNPVEDAPIPNVDGNLDTFNITEDQTFIVDDQALLTNDIEPDGQPFTLEALDLVVEPTLADVSQLTFSPAQLTWRYDPTAAFDYLDDGEPATDRFWYTSVDINSNVSQPAQVIVNIIGVNDGPKPDPVVLDPTDDTLDLGTTDDNTSVDYNLALLGVTDPEGHTFEFVAPDPAQSTLLAGLSIDDTDPLNPILTYDPDVSPTLNAMFDGTESMLDTFVVIARDSEGAETAIPVKILVTGADDPIQVLYPPTLDAFSDQPLDFNIADGLPDPNLANAFFDPDSDIVFLDPDETFTLGEITGTGGSYTYDPNGQFNHIVYPAKGMDTFVLNAISVNNGNVSSSASPTVEITIEQDVRLPVIEGVVFVDANGNGVQDPWENPISGVEITIDGVDVTGADVYHTVVTGPDGAYSFAESEIGVELIIGNYLLIEGQPEFMLDGLDLMNGVPSPFNDVIPITDAGSVPGDFVFTELGLDPAYLSLAPYLTTTPQEGILMAFDANGDLAWTFADDSWDGYTVQTAGFSPDLSTLFVTVEDPAGGIHILEVPTGQNQQYCPYSMDGDTGVLRLNGPPGNFIP